MDLQPRLQLINALVAGGLTGASEAELIRGFRWSDIETNESDEFEYRSTSEGEAAENWRRSVFFHMLDSGEVEFAIDLSNCAAYDFSMIDDLAAKGHRHFLGFVHRFGEAGSIGQMDCVYSYWLTRRAEGFSEPELAALRDLVPTLGLAVKTAAQARIARTVGRVYLGRDAGEQVMRGRITRGVTEKIGAVLWFSDLRGSTGISEAIGPDQIIPFLNDYAGATIEAIHDAGGDVLKLIGDGVLAVFTGSDMAAARRAALKAEHQFRQNITAVNSRRTAEGQPVTTGYLGLHVGEVFYGNIGSEDRLDFTVVGPAVNEVARIASMCSSVDRQLLVSSEFRAGLDEAGKGYLVSTGRFALRGIGHALTLYTLDPGLQSDGGLAERYDHYLA